jgi:DNA end-binding protein Ku
MPRRAKPDPKPLKMATQLLDSLDADWDPKQYRDTYTEELRKRITAKDKGKGKKVADDAPAEKDSAKIVDLMAALEQSVEAAKGRTRKPRARKSA